MILTMASGTMTFTIGRTSFTGGNLSFLEYYERVDLCNLTDSTNATFTYTSYELNDDGVLVVDGTGSGTISLVQDSYELHLIISLSRIFPPINLLE